MPQEIFSLPAPRARLDDIRNSAYWMLPDIFKFEFSAEEYETHWAIIKAASSWLVTDECTPKSEVVRQYAWEKVKKTVGYTDYCHPARVHMAMLKLLYFGYIYGLNTKELLTFPPDFLNIYPLSEDFLSACQNPRNNVTSHWLQRELIGFYNKHKQHLNGRTGDPIRTVDSYFGESYTRGANADDLRTFAKLDPQTPNFERCRQLNISRTLEGSTLRKGMVERNLQGLRDRYLELMPVQRSTAVAIWQTAMQLLTSTAPAHAGTIVNDLRQLIQQAEALAAFWPTLSREHHTFYVPLYGECIKALNGTPSASSINEVRRLSEQAYLVIKTLPIEEACRYLDAFFLNNEVGCLVMEMDLPLVEQWIQSLYTKIKENQNSPDVIVKAIRVIVNKPYYIEDEYLKFFIEIAVAHVPLTHVIGLLDRLHEIEPARAYAYILQHAQLEEHIPQGTLLARGYAEKLALYTLNRPNQHTLWGKPTRLVMLKPDEALRTMARLDPEIYYRSENAASVGFSTCVQKQQWQEAWEIMSNRQALQLSNKGFKQKDLEKLASVYYAESVELNRLANMAIVQSSDYRQAESLYRQSLDLLTKVLCLSDTQVYRTTINHVRRMLMDVMLKGDTVSSSISITRMDEALNFLTQIQDTLSAEADIELNQVVCRWYDIGISHYYQACMIDNPDSSVVSKEHAAIAQESVLKLCDLLKKSIHLRSRADLYGSIAPLENQTKLAAAHFLLAECTEYFSEELLDVVHHYQKACELVPNQAFYWMRAYEVSNTHAEYQEKGLELLAHTGLNATDYMHWYDERWMSASKRIHRVSMPEPVPVESYLSQLSRWVFSA